MSDRTPVIVVVGPPAVGKHTVAKALAEQTGYRLLDRDLAVAAVEAVLPGGAGGGGRPALRALRLLLVGAALYAGTPGIIVTYGCGIDDHADFVDDLADVAAHEGGVMRLVRLDASADTLAERAGCPDRAARGKPGIGDHLKSQTQAYYSAVRNLRPADIRLVVHSGIGADIVAETIAAQLRTDLPASAIR